MSAGASKELSSFFLFGKNLRLVGASVKDCVLLYKRTEGEVLIRIETMIMAIMIMTIMVMAVMAVMMMAMVMAMMMMKLFRRQKVVDWKPS